MEQQIRILGINGSPHIHGIGSQLLNEVLVGAQHAGANTNLISLVEKIKEFPPENYGKAMPDSLNDLSHLIKTADGIIFSTPVHWFNVSTLMKALLDFMTPLEYPSFPLKGKIAGFIATCDEDGGQQAISLMAAALNHYGFIIPPWAMLFHNNKTAGQSEGKWQERDYQLLGKNVVKLITVTKNLAWDT